MAYIEADVQASKTLKMPKKNGKSNTTKCVATLDLGVLRPVATLSTGAGKEPVSRFAFSDVGTRSSDRQPQRNELGLRVPVTDPAIRPWRSILKMNVLSVVFGTIATISAILGLAWCGLHL